MDKKPSNVLFWPYKAPLPKVGEIVRAKFLPPHEILIKVEKVDHVNNVIYGPIKVVEHDGTTTKELWEKN